MIRVYAVNMSKVRGLCRRVVKRETDMEAYAIIPRRSEMTQTTQVKVALEIRE